MDYDLDGRSYLAVGNYFSNPFPPITEYENFIFRNDNGVLDTFPRWISSDMRNTNDIAWGDVNGDGRPDLLSTSGSFAKSVIYFNSASGLSTSPGWIQMIVTGLLEAHLPMLMVMVTSKWHLLIKVFHLIRIDQ